MERQIIDQGYDNLLQVDYVLYKSTLAEAKKWVRSWYEGYDLTEFDSQSSNEFKREKEILESKKAAIACNLLFACKEGDRYYLLDGFNRLLTDYAEVDGDAPVLLKVITSPMQPNKVMSLMLRFNLWKLSTTGTWHCANIDLFFDRGLKLLLKSMFNVSFYSFDNYHTRERGRRDMNVIQNYFTNETKDYGVHPKSYSSLCLLFDNKRIVDDIKEIVAANNYLNEPFSRCNFFVDGFANYLSELRISGDMEHYTFDHFLEMLYADKKFFTKLQGMSNTDVTRKNVYAWFRKELIKSTNLLEIQ